MINYRNCKCLYWYNKLEDEVRGAVSYLMMYISGVWSRVLFHKYTVLYCFLFSIVRNELKERLVEKEKTTTPIEEDTQETSRVCNWRIVYTFISCISMGS